MTFESTRHSKASEVDGPVSSFKTIALLVIVVAFVSLLMLAIYSLKMAAANALPQEYEGVIVDRWAGFNEDQQGSSPYFRLTVELQDKRRLVVPVDRDFYNRAKVGMRLKKSAAGFEILPGRSKLEGIMSSG